MEMSKTEGRRILRSLELKAYRGVVDALRAQGALTKNKYKVLKSLANTLKVGEERSRSEIRRAVNNSLLTSIAESTNEKNTDSTWRSESVRKIPVIPMLAPETVFTALADNISDIVASHNREFLESTPSLIDLVKACDSRTKDNVTRYHSSKVLEPLLSNKTFKEDAIFAQLEKIKLKNQNSHVNNNFYKVPKKYISCRTEDSNNYSEQISKDGSILRQHQFLASVQASSKMNENITLSSKTVHPSCSLKSKQLLKKDDVVKEDSNSSSWQKGTSVLNTSSRVRRAKLVGKRWNPRTHALETMTSEDRNAPENSNKSKTTNEIQRKEVRTHSNIQKSTKQKTTDDYLSRQSELNDEQKAKNTSPNRQTRCLKRKHCSRPKTRKVSKFRKNDLSQKPILFGSTAKTKRLKQKLRISDDCTKKNALKLRVRGKNISTNLHENQCSLKEVNEVLDSNNDGLTNVQMLGTKETKTNDNNFHILEPKETKTDENNMQILGPKEKKTDGNIETNKIWNQKPVDNLETETPYNGEGWETSSKLPDTDVLSAAMSTSFEDDETRPHTFNLIPTSRRLKILKKSAISPTIDSEIPFKKFHGVVSPLDTNMSMVSESVSSNDEIETCSSVTTIQTVNDLCNSLNNSKTPTANTQLSGNRNRKAPFSPISNNSSVTNLSLLGNIKVLNLNNVPAISDIDVDAKHVNGSSLNCKSNENNSSKKFPHSETHLLAENEYTNLRNSKPVKLPHVNDEISSDDSVDLVICNTSSTHSVDHDSSKEIDKVEIATEETCKRKKNNQLEQLIDIKSADTILRNNEISTVNTQQDDVIQCNSSESTELSTVEAVTRSHEDTTDSVCKSNVVIVNVDKNILTSSSETNNTVKVNEMNSDTEYKKPFIKELNSNKLSAVPFRTSRETLKFENSSLAAKREIVNSTASITLNLKKTCPKYRKLASIKTICRPSIINSRDRFKNCMSTDSVIASIIDVSEIPTGSSSELLLKKTTTQKADLISKARITESDKLHRETENMNKSIQEELQSPISSFRKSSVILKKNVLDSVRKSTFLPPVSKKVYELYESQSKINECNTQMLVNSVLSTSAKKITVEKINPATMIEISSLEEEIEIVHDTNEIDSVNDLNVISIADIGSPSSDNS